MHVFKKERRLVQYSSISAVRCCEVVSQEPQIKASLYGEMFLKHEVHDIYGVESLSWAGWRVYARVPEGVPVRAIISRN